MNRSFDVIGGGRAGGFPRRNFHVVDSAVIGGIWVSRIVHVVILRDMGCDSAIGNSINGESLRILLSPMAGVGTSLSGPDSRRASFAVICGFHRKWFVGTGRSGSGSH
jgi:hypothetical protein